MGTISRQSWVECKPWGTQRQGFPRSIHRRTLSRELLVEGATESFYGKEDPQLSNALMKELPGILLWALDGLDRLRERGYFIQPKSGKAALEQLEELGSPVLSFVRQKCDVGPGYSITPEKLYESWKRDCQSNGRPPGTTQTFGRDLHAAVPGLEITQPRIGGQQIRMYQGIRLKQARHRGRFGPDRQ